MAVAMWGSWWASPSGNLLVLGGNQGDEVNIREFPLTRVTGYRWPLNEPMPAGELPIGTPPSYRWGSMSTLSKVMGIVGLLLVLALYVTHRRNVDMQRTLGEQQTTITHLQTVNSQQATELQEQQLMTTSLRLLLNDQNAALADLDNRTGRPPMNCNKRWPRRRRAPGLCSRASA